MKLYIKLKHHYKICGNEWSSYLSSSNTHSCSFWNGSVLLELAESDAGDSGTPSTIIYTQWSSRHYELGCDGPVVEYKSLDLLVFYSSFHIMNP